MFSTRTQRAPAHELLAGARAMTTWLTGIVPFGFVIGVSVARADVPMLAGWLTGPLIFSGSAQVATLQLLDAHAMWLVVLLGGLLLNARLVLYSAVMTQHWHGAGRWFRYIAAYTMVEPTIAVGTEGYRRNGDTPAGHFYYAGGALTLWLAWIASITAGATLGVSLPPSLHLEFVIPLFLLGEVVARATTTAVKRGVSAAIVLAVLGQSVPLQAGTLIAIVGGVVAAVTTKETSS
jgi:predicted branched-subunit amino acid permease